VHINSASALLTLTENNNKPTVMGTVVKSPANQLAITQRRFFTTKKARKKQCKSLNKPTTDEKKEVKECLLEDKSLYKEATAGLTSKQGKLHPLYIHSQIRNMLPLYTLWYFTFRCNTFMLQSHITRQSDKGPQNPP